MIIRTVQLYKLHKYVIYNYLMAIKKTNCLREVNI
jgi:hypothetical protein